MAIMPQLNREDHEKLLSDLLNPELEQSARTEILTQLRDNYTGFTTEYETVNKKVEKLTQDNSDLVISNSKLFRQTGVLGDNPKPKEEKEKEFSETIKLSDIEKTL
jgi:2-succinyl-5-enolpyruvyl-6-hydroxy-3-cyclohexene-1-carboxylate synthase